MTINRELIYSALWSLAANSAQYATANRRLRHWGDVAPAECPALFSSEKGGNSVSKALGAPQVWTLDVDYYIYVHSSDAYQSPSILLNPLLDALEAALGPGNSLDGLQHLGMPEMVQHVRVQGRLETDEGTLGDMAIAIMPVQILCVAQ